MGEIYKDPENEAQTVTIKAEPDGTINKTENILRFLIQAEGAARLVRLTQYAFEDLANEIETIQPAGQPAPQLADAAKYLRCAETLETAYEKIKNEIRI